MKYAIITILIVLNFNSKIVAQCNHPDDYKGLRAIYLSTDGDNWTNNSGWPNAAFFNANPTLPAGTNFSNWHGVFCNLNNRVYVLSFNNNNLTGSIPSDISFISNLASLGIKRNPALAGVIPATISSLINLSNIDLSENNLGGNINWISSLVNLNWLNLSKNQFSGSIPTGVTNLVGLGQLILSNNSLSGSIPTGISNCPIWDLQLQNNQFNGDITWLGNMPYLSVINLNNNDFSGTIPPSLGNLSQLTHFSLSHNNLSGNIPSQLANINYIKFGFDLSYNNLTGSIPMGLTFGSLWFDISNNNLCGPIPVDFNDHFNNWFAEQVNISNNNLSGCYPSSLIPICDSLELLNGIGLGNPNELISDGNNFNAPFEDFCLNTGIGQCGTGQLNCSNLDYNILETFYNNTNGANWTNKTGWLQNCIPCGDCSNSPWYGITCNTSGQITGIGLPNNNLVGTLSNTLHSISSLEILNLSQNQISGVIPSSLGNGNIDILMLGGNQLTGSIPSGLSTIGSVILNNNQLTGSIPPSFGSSGMQGLVVSNNLLCGCYDASLSGLCGSLGTNSQNSLISDGNNFQAPWQTFCTGANGVGSCNSPFQLCYHPDWNGLLSLYSTNGIFWTNNTGWLNNCDPCGECGNNDPWFGITCENNRVVGINLPQNGILGNIPAALSQLTKLKTLNLRGNLLTGSIPPQLGNLQDLTILNLGKNELTGSIPTTFCNLMPELTSLALDNNQLSGCYDAALSCLCPLPNLNSISGANNFPTPFSAFCATGDGNCSDNCIDLDGTNDYLQRNGLASSGDFSISAWFNAGNTGNGGDDDRILSFGPTDRLEIGIVESTGILWLYDEFFGSVQTFGANLRDNNWHHIVLSRSGNVNTIFLDGLFLTTYNVTSPSYGPNFRVGNWTGGTANAFFDGKIDDVSVWNIPLTPADITTLQTCELNGTEFGLDAHYDFNTGISAGMNNSITMIEDKTANTNDLTIMNMAMQGTTSNLIFSNTGVYNNCSLCSAPPVAACNSGFIKNIIASIGSVSITTAEINNMSTSGCGGALTYSFHPTNSVTSMTYNCGETGTKNLTLYVTSNGVQSSCNAIIEVEYADPSLSALKEIYESTNGDSWVNTIANDRKWFIDCDPCGINDGTPWFGITCNINSTINDIKIKTLTLQNNNLVGVLPDAFSPFNHIEWFQVHGNANLRGNIPPTFCDMNTLQQITLGNTGIGTDISGNELPAPTISNNCFSNFTQLVTLGTQHNTTGHFKGPLPELSPVAPIINLYFDHNKFSSIPESYCDLNFTATTTLRLNNNPFLDDCYKPCFLKFCSGYPNFTNAEISNSTGMTPWSDFCDPDLDPNSDEMVGLAHLYYAAGGDNWVNIDNRPWFVDCDPCGINDGTPWYGISCYNSGSNMGKVREIKLIQNNNLTGTVTPHIDEFSKLLGLEMANSQTLQGNIPDSICNIDTLRRIVFSNTGMSDTIPPCIADTNYMPNLALLSIQDSDFDGPLPSFGSQNIQLEFFTAGNNNFTGPIPPSYGAIPQIANPNALANRLISVRGNQLTGSYDNQLLGLCQNPHLTDAFINTANVGLTSWSAFCTACPSNLIIDWTPIVSGTYKSSGSIQILNPNAIVAPNSTVIFSHGFGSNVTLPASLTTQIGSTISIQNTGCN